MHTVTRLNKLFTPAVAYLDDAALAKQYVGQRLHSDVAALQHELFKALTPHCGNPFDVLDSRPKLIMRADMYGTTTIMVDTTRNGLHASPCFGDVYIKGESDPYMVECAEQVLAYLLAKHW